METKLSEKELIILARMHMACHPEAAITALGIEFVTDFYAFVADSQSENLFLHRDEGKIVGGCLLSLAPQTISSRFRKNTPLRTWLPKTVAKLSPSAFIRFALQEIMGMIRPRAAVANEPEVIYIFDDPDTRRVGFGRHLLAACESFMAGVGISSYVVRTWDDSEHPTVLFFVRNGFILGEIVETYGKSLRFMKKAITPRHSMAGEALVPNVAKE